MDTANGLMHVSPLFTLCSCTLALFLHFALSAANAAHKEANRMKFHHSCQFYVPYSPMNLVFTFPTTQLGQLYFSLSLSFSLFFSSSLPLPTPNAFCLLYYFVYIKGTDVIECF